MRQFSIFCLSAVRFVTLLSKKSRRCHSNVCCLMLLLCFDNFRWFVCLYRSLFPFTYAFDAVYVICSSTFITLSSSDKWIDQNGYEHIVYIWQSYVSFFSSLFCLVDVVVAYSWVSLSSVWTLFDRQNIVFDAAVINNNKFVYFCEINDDLNTFFCELLSIVNVFRTFCLFSQYSFDRSIISNGKMFEFKFKFKFH